MSCLRTHRAKLRQTPAIISISFVAAVAHSLKNVCVQWLPNQPPTSWSCQPAQGVPQTPNAPHQGTTLYMSLSFQLLANKLFKLLSH